MTCKYCDKTAHPLQKALCRCGITETIAQARAAQQHEQKHDVQLSIPEIVEREGGVVRASDLAHKLEIHGPGPDCQPED